MNVKIVCLTLLSCLAINFTHASDKEVKMPDADSITNILHEWYFDEFADNTGMPQRLANQNITWISIFIIVGDTIRMDNKLQHDSLGLVENEIPPRRLRYNKRDKITDILYSAADKTSKTS